MKTVITDNAGRVDIEVPSDCKGTFEPVILARHQRRLSGVDEIVLSLTAKGLTTGEISAHFPQIYGASVSKEAVSRSPLGQPGIPLEDRDLRVPTVEVGLLWAYHGW